MSATTLSVQVPLKVGLSSLCPSFSTNPSICRTGNCKRLNQVSLMLTHAQMIKDRITTYSMTSVKSADLKEH